MATAAVKNTFIQQPLNDFIKDCENDLKDNKYDAVKSGISIASDIMQEFIATRMAAAVQDQKPTAEPQDLFTMMRTLTKSNAALSVMINRAEYHEKLMRTMGSKYGSDIEAVKAQVVDVVDKVKVQVSTHDVIGAQLDLDIFLDVDHLGFNNINVTPVLGPHGAHQLLVVLSSANHS